MCHALSSVVEVEEWSDELAHRHCQACRVDQEQGRPETAENAQEEFHALLYAELQGADLDEGGGRAWECRVEADVLAMSNVASSKI